MTHCHNKEYQIELPFFKNKNKKVLADFKGGKITSDAGAVLLGAVNKKYNLTKRIVQCLVEKRDERYTEHSLENLILQRITQIACGYEDCNDANSLRVDPIFKLIADRNIEESEEDLASQPTLSRLENSVTNKEFYRLGKAMLQLYLDTKDKNTKRIILDLDTTDDSTYGGQQLSFFHGYFGEYVYLPLLIFDGETGKLITAILRPGNKGAGYRAVSILKRIVKKIREKFPDVEIIIRGDSGFATPEMYEYCESVGISYIIALIKNERLEAANETNIQWAYWLFKMLAEKQRLFNAFEYQANSWKHARKVIAKSEWNEKGSNQRFLVTNLDGEAIKIYDKEYAPRGEECENRIKELKLDLKMDRLSCTKFYANQFRLFLHGFAYWLLHLLRCDHLKNTELEKAQFGTIRLKLLKIGAQIVSTCRRIWIHIASGYPFKNLFASLIQQFYFSSA